MILFRPSAQEAEKAKDAPGTVIRFPQNGAPTPQDIQDREPPEPIWKGYAEPGSHLALTLEEFAAADPSFTPRTFVEGAKMAYEMIIDGFAKGDKSVLKNLLSRDVFESFAKAIDSREAAGHRIESRFVGIDKSIIEQASLIGSKASVTVRFVSELITATYSKSGDLVEGDPNANSGSDRRLDVRARRVLA